MNNSNYFSKRESKFFGKRNGSGEMQNKMGHNYSFTKCKTNSNFFSRFLSSCPSKPAERGGFLLLVLNDDLDRDERDGLVEEGLDLDHLLDLDRHDHDGKEAWPRPASGLDPTEHRAAETPQWGRKER